MNPVDWIQYDVYGNSLMDWAIGLGLFLIVWVALAAIKSLLKHRLTQLETRTDRVLVEIAAHVVAQTRSWFLFLVALFVGSRYWELPSAIGTAAYKVVMVALLIQAGLWVRAAFLELLEDKRERELEENPGGVAAMDILSFVARVAIWSVVLLMILDNLGVNITALVAGLGVGGIAVALAAQNILGDLFASLSIVLDKPFVVGDFLIIGDFLGSVEKVGIKTTRVRSLSGEQLIFSNNDLLNSRIRNYGRMFERRVVFSIGVTYQTGIEHLRAIPGIIREAVESNEAVRFDRAHFQKYGDFALVFETVYYVLSPDYNQYMDIQQAVNLTLFERFAEEGIEFAYPTQTLHLEKQKEAS